MLLAAPPVRNLLMSRGNDAALTDEIEDLVKRAQKGDNGAFAGLYEAFHAKIYRYVYFKVSDRVEAEDLTEEVFLRMLESINSFKWQGYPFSSWLFRIAHNRIIDHYRKKGRQRTVELDDAGSVVGVNTDDMDRNLEVRLSIEQVDVAMRGLTQLQKEVITLRFAGGLSIAETADAMGKKDNAVKALQHAAIKKLRTTLPDHLVEQAVAQKNG